MVNGDLSLVVSPRHYAYIYIYVYQTDYVSVEPTHSIGASVALSL